MIGRLNRRHRRCRKTRVARRGGTHVDNQRQELVNLGLEGEGLGLFRHGVWWVSAFEGVVRLAALDEVTALSFAFAK